MLELLLPHVALSRAGIPDGEIGARSPHAFAQVVNLVLQYGVPCFSAVNATSVTAAEMNSATTDLVQLLRRELGGRIVKAAWRGESYKPITMIRCLFFNNEREKAWLEADCGCSLGRTLEIERQGSKHAWCLYGVSPNDPDWDFDYRPTANRTRFVRHFPIPGSVDLQSGLPFQWRHAPGEVKLQTLPPSLRYVLPCLNRMSAAAPTSSKLAHTTLWTGDRPWSAGRDRDRSRDTADDNEETQAEKEAARKKQRSAFNPYNAGKKKRSKRVDGVELPTTLEYVRRDEFKPQCGQDWYND